MGYDISGWVEVRPVEEQPWEAAIKVDALTRRDSQVRALLLGVAPGTPELVSFAANRGLPPDASYEAREWDPAEGPTGNFAHSWVLWSELEHTAWSHGMGPSGPLTDEWQLLFEMMGRLGAYFGAENVRLVVWVW